MEETSKIVNTGLRGVPVASTRIGFIDGETGRLLYRGYRIQDLADKAIYEEIVHLLLRDKLPAQEELQRLQETRPDLIILDVMMRTSQEGFELSRELKHNPDFRDIPILMLTGVKQKTGLDFKPAAGDEDWLPVEEYLDKPVKPDMLLEKVDALLTRV